LTEGPNAGFVVMGIVNVTPDSFSDGGRFLDADRAVAHGLALAREGAGILDIGGESTRPGAQPVSAAEELRRVIPVIGGLRAADATLTISVDTSKASVAAAALDAGAEIVNDVTALRGDPEMAGLIAARGARCVLTHMRGEPRTMQDDPRYEDVVAEVAAFLSQRLRMAVDHDIDAERVWLDPGIGFGKTVAHNLELLRRLRELTALGRPLVLGASRKSFLGGLTGRDHGDRGAATIAANVVGFQGGARIFRVHDVAWTRDALRVVAATVPADG
jgi:dihydropteroate synthase